MFEKWTHRPGPIGLDIGCDCIKMLQLDTVGKAVSAVAAAHWRFPDNVGIDAALRRRFAVDAVGQMLVDGGFRGRSVVTCLNSEEMIVKQIRLPHMTAEDLKSAVQWEANERFGFKVDPDLLHYVVAGEVRQGSESRDEVILLGARGETVDEHVRMLAEMRLAPVCVDAEPACLFRPFERHLRRQGDLDKVTLLVDVGASSTRVLFGRGRQVKFIKSIPLGGRKLTQAVAAALGLEFDQAWQVRRQIMREGRDGGAAAVRAAGGEDAYRAVHEAQRPVVEELSREISMCLRYCSVTFRGDRWEAAKLVGGEAYDPCLREMLSEGANVRVELGLPLAGVDVAQVDLGADHRGPMCEWAVAAGLAMRHLFAQTESREKDNAAHRLSA
jgi:type IV pilus assembly protein PilM